MPEIISALAELAEPPAFADLLVLTDVSDTSQAATGTTKKNKGQYTLGVVVNAQTGTTYTYLTTDFRKLVTHTNGSAIAGTLPQAGASFPANWWMFVQNRGAGVLTITPTTSTIDGAATLVLNQNEGAIVVSNGTNYFTLRGKATGAAGVGDVVGPGSSTDNALVRFDSTTGKLIQNSTVTLDDTGALTFPEMAAPSTPAAGKVALYAKSDGLFYSKDDAGTETVVTGGGGGAGYAGVTTGGTGSLDFAQGTKTADEPFIDATVTWNAGGVTFNGIKTNATVTAAALGSNLLDLQAGGVSQFAVRLASGTTQFQVNVPNGTTSLPGITGSDTNTGIRFEENANWMSFVCDGSIVFRMTDSNIQVVSAGGITQVNGGPYRWNSSTRLLDGGNGILQIEGNSGNQGVGLLLGVSNTTQGARLTRNGVLLESKLGDDSAYTKHLASAFRGVEVSANPSAADLTSGANAKDRVEMYMKADTLVFAYNNAGTVTYVKLALDGSATTWVHNTSAP